MIKNLLAKRKIDKKKSNNNWITIILVDDSINEFCLEDIPNDSTEMNFLQLKEYLEKNRYSLRKSKGKNIAIYLAFKEKNM
jgi:hypothetical protein